MLETVTKGFRAAKNRLAGKSELTQDVVDESLRDIRVSLLEADVSFDVVKKFVARVREKTVGEVVQTTITDTSGQKRKVSPADYFVKICHDELEALMGPVDTSLKLKPKGQLSGIMMVGLQGSGKTTGDGSGGPGYEIYCECHQENARQHFRGTLSMAHIGRDTGGSQFFLTFKPTTHLNGRHTAFGRVIEGQDVLAKLQRRDPTRANPPQPDKIVKATVVRKRDHKYEPTKVK
jgi:cyclophilin family peptidyl-prolyl cis-trans isomerase